MDNKGQPWGPAVVVFIYVYCIDINIEQLISCSNKHKLAPEKIYFTDFVIFGIYKQQSITS